MKRKSEQTVNLIVEYTEGYQQRFTKGILKIFENHLKRGDYDEYEIEENQNKQDVS